MLPHSPQSDTSPELLDTAETIQSYAGSSRWMAGTLLGQLSPERA